MTLKYDGYLYIDNLNYARSTKVYHNGTGFVPEPSGMTDTDIMLDFGSLWTNNTPKETTISGKTPKYGGGYKSRTTPCRIRAVYRSGTK